jgi:hypothetical protein
VQGHELLDRGERQESVDPAVPGRRQQAQDFRDQVGQRDRRGDRGGGGPRDHAQPEAEQGHDGQIEAAGQDRALDERMARRRGVQAQDDPQGRGLARAVRPEEAGHPPGTHRETQPVDCGDRAEPLGDLVDLDHGRGALK